MPSERDCLEKKQDLIDNYIAENIETCIEQIANDFTTREKSALIKAMFMRDSSEAGKIIFQKINDYAESETSIDYKSWEVEDDLYMTEGNTY